MKQEQLTYDNLITTLEKISSIFRENGFPEDSVSINFNPKSMDSKLTVLADKAQEKIKNLSLKPEKPEASDEPDYPITVDRIRCCFFCNGSIISCKIIFD
jgi:phosphoketolase